MVTVRLFGLFRLHGGVKELTLEAATVRDIYPAVIARIRENRPEAPLTEEMLRDGVIIIDGKTARPGTGLRDGDVVNIMSPVAGG